MNSMPLEGEIWEAILTGATAADAHRLAARCVEAPKCLEVVAQAARELEGDKRALAFAVMKKVAETEPALLEPFREVLLDLDHPGDPWTVPLLAAQAAALVSWLPSWHQRLRDAFEPRLDDPNKFVKAWALRVLGRIAEPGSDLHETLMKICDRFLGEGGALAASARIVRGASRRATQKWANEASN